MTVELAAIGTRPAPPQSSASHVVRTALIVFVVALVVSLGMVFIGFRSQSLVANTFDPYYFGEMGKSLARGEGFAAYGSLIQRRAPLYPLLIGGLYTAFGEQSLLVLLTQALLFAATSVVVFDIGRRLFNQRTGVVGGAVRRLQPDAAALRRGPAARDAADLPDDPDHLVLGALLRAADRWLGDRDGGLCGVRVAHQGRRPAVPVPVRGRRPGAEPLPPLAGRGGARHSVGPPGRAVRHAGDLHRPVDGAQLHGDGREGRPDLVGRQRRVPARLHLHRPEFATLRLPPYTDAENESNDLFISLAQAAGTEWQRDDYETDQILNRAAQARFLADPLDFMRKFTVGLFTFWYEMTNLPNSLLAGALALAAWALAIVGLVRSARERRPAWLLLLPIIYLNLFLAALLALGRYSVPILPPLLILAAFGVDTLINRFGPRAAARD